MRILLLNQYYPPDTAATARVAQQIAEGLSRHHQVTVLAGWPSYAPTERPVYRIWSRERRGSLTIERVGSFAFPRRPMWKRFANYLSYFSLAFPRAMTIRAEVILAMTDPPMEGLFGALVAWLRRKPFVYNLRDLYPEYVMARGLVRDRGWVRLWQQAHRWALRRAARVIVLGEDMRERVIAQDADPARTVVMRGGDPLPDGAGSSSERLVRRLRGDASFVVMHAGTLGFSGAWKTILEGLKQLNGLSVGCVFVGDGIARRDLEAQAAVDARVRFFDFFPQSEWGAVLSAADAHLVTLRRGLEGTTLPGKLYPILAAGRPVLAVAPETSDLARLVRQIGCGVVADPDDPASVAHAIRQLIAHPEQVAQMRERAQAAAVEFTPARYVERLRQVIEDAVAR